MLSVFTIAVALTSGCTCPSSSVPATDAGSAAELQRAADLALLPQTSGDLAAQMAAEAAARTNDTPSLEGVIASATKEGVGFNAPHQGFGRKLFAIYCATADSVDGVIVTVCEYPSPDQATRGEAEVKIIGSKMAGFQSAVRKKSVLQLVTRSDTPPATLEKIRAAFDSL